MDVKFSLNGTERMFIQDNKTKLGYSLGFICIEEINNGDLSRKIKELLTKIDVEDYSIVFSSDFKSHQYGYAYTLYDAEVFNWI